MSTAGVSIFNSAQQLLADDRGTADLLGFTDADVRAALERQAASSAVLQCLTAAEKTDVLAALRLCYDGFLF